MLTLSMPDKKFSRRQFEIFFLLFQKTGLTFWHEIANSETIYMKGQSLFSEKKNKKNVINLSSAEFDHRMKKIKL